MNRSILLLSSSVVHGYGYLEYNRDAIVEHLEGLATPLLFVPYAGADWDAYTARVGAAMALLGVKVTGIHTVPEERIFTDFEAVFTGGGNTFRLLNTMQELQLLPRLREAVLAGRMSYLGSSAGTNLATRSICTTNDMPIVYPKSGFEALNLFPYQINPHYIDADPASRHMGETREQRLAEFHEMNDVPVVGLREGAYLRLGADFGQTHQLFVGGAPGAKLFRKGREAMELPREEWFRFDATLAG